MHKLFIHIMFYIAQLFTGNKRGRNVDKSGAMHIYGHILYCNWSTLDMRHLQNTDTNTAAFSSDSMFLCDIQIRSCNTIYRNYSAYHE